MKKFTEAQQEEFSKEMKKGLRKIMKSNETTGHCPNCGENIETMYDRSRREWVCSGCGTKIK